jgi:hypothetical protein
MAGKGVSVTSYAQITGGNDLFRGVKYGGPRAWGLAHDVNPGMVLRACDLPFEMRLPYWLYWHHTISIWSGV